MQNRNITSERLAELLVIFGRKIEILSSNNEYSWNKHAENVLIPLLNLVFNLDLKNANIEKEKNMPAIDLWDLEKKVVIQITSTANYAKIKSTVEKFKKHGFIDEFNDLRFVFLKEKAAFNLSTSQTEELKTITSNKLSVTNSDLYDFRKLHELTQIINIEEVDNLLITLENEIGAISGKIIEYGPATTLIFDDTIDDNLELAFKIAKGLLDLGIRVKHFSDKLVTYQKGQGYSSDYFIRIYEKSKEAKSTIILSDFNLRKKILIEDLNPGIIETLRDQHSFHILFKLENNAGINDLNYLKPIIFRANKNSFQQIIDLASLEIRKQMVAADIQGYSDFETIIKLYDKNSNFANPIDFSDHKKKIGYTLLKAIDSFKGNKTYYLLLYRGSNLTATKQKFFQDYPDVEKDKTNLIIFLPKENKQKLLSERLDNSRKIFKVQKAIYLDEFVLNYCSGRDDNFDHVNVKYSSVNHFVIPDLKAIEGSLTDYDQIENWLSSDYDPMLIITGGGGIGKTTLAKDIADKFIVNRPNSRVFFIEASDSNVQNYLLRISDSRPLDLYDFYLAAFNSTSISRDIFRINIDNGNFLLIIDGLDEVFSRIPDFNVSYFIESVSGEFIKDFGAGKVLLTCRTYFWKERISKESYINHIELEPFSYESTHEYFSSKFNNNIKNIERSFGILKSLTRSENLKIEKVLPYIADIVTKIVESGGDLLSENESSSTYLNLKSKNDYVVYRLLVREWQKTGAMNVDDQCKFFIDFSVFGNGRLKEKSLYESWISKTGKKLDSTSQNALKSHPLLYVSGDNILFKYDFFELFFKGIYLAETISIENQNKISESFIKILLEEGKFGSSLFYETSNRCIEKWNDNYIVRISYLIDEILKLSDDFYEFDNSYKKQAISALFALGLMINQDKLDDRTSTNTDLIKHIFGKKNEIDGLSMVRFGSGEKNIKFNFSGLTLKNCYFDSYDAFWTCIYDENTRFENCTFYNMPPYDDLSSKCLNLNQFSNSRKDSTFDDYFEWRISDSNSKRKEIQNVLEKYFNLYYSNGYLHPQRHNSVIQKRYTPKLRSIISLEELEDVLMRNYVIKKEFNKVAREERTEIESNFKEDVIQFTKEATPSIKIVRLIDELLALSN